MRSGLLTTDAAKRIAAAAAWPAGPDPVTPPAAAAAAEWADSRLDLLDRDLVVAGCRARLMMMACSTVVLGSVIASLAGVLRVEVCARFLASV